jgi:prevent-host-death family protein
MARESTMRVGLREANQKFAELVKAARNGKEVIITDRGKPVARLTSIRGGTTSVVEDDEEAILKRLEESGFLRRPVDPGQMRPFKPVKLRGKSIVETIREMRDEED